MSSYNTSKDLADSPHIGGQKMSSSLKERLKRSRLHSSPLSHPSSPCTSLAAKPASSPLTNPHPPPFDIKEDIPEYSKEDIENCEDIIQIQGMHNRLLKNIANSNEKLRKLTLVQKHHNKNNPDDLLLLIQKWLNAAQDGILKLHELLPEPKPPTTLSLLNVLQIDVNLVKFNCETGSFK